MRRTAPRRSPALTYDAGILGLLLYDVYFRKRPHLIFPCDESEIETIADLIEPRYEDYGVDLDELEYLDEEEEEKISRQRYCSYSPERIAELKGAIAKAFGETS